ncbi:MAG TPA: DUF222 domain-containing protein, partial [Candidatus Dormibacteraeota bacterium]|nr:DUF222 domain-containing protein [Candidatus Dormibacteraeota bacterium]
MRTMAAAPSSLAVSPLQMAADALDLLEREDPAEMPAAALGEEIEELFTLQHRVAAAITRRVAVFDRGKGCAALEAHSTAAWLRRQVRLAPNAASEQVRVARELDRRPEVGRAFSAGEVGFAHAQVITRVLEDAPAEVA